MKKYVLSLVMVLAMIATGFAASGTLSGTLGISDPPITITKTQDLSLSVTQVAGQTSYTKPFSSVTPATFSVSGSANRAVSVTTTISQLTRGSATATLNVTAYCDQTQTPTESSTDCTNASIGSSGNLYIAVYPQSVEFDASNTAGNYTGTLTVTVDYK